MNLSKLKSFSKFSSKGFTLIELLIVIAILGILAAVVLVAINPGQRIAAARNSRVKSDLSSMGNQANVFNADTGLNATCIGGGSYPNALPTALICGASYMTGGAPVSPTNTAYDYEAFLAAGGTLACAGPNTATPCGAIAIAGPAYPDPNSVPAVTNTTSLWCWRSEAGTLTLVANDAACTP